MAVEVERAIGGVVSEHFFVGGDEIEAREADGGPDSNRERTRVIAPAAKGDRLDDAHCCGWLRCGKGETKDEDVE
jgi:hypothetical protein